MTNSPVPAPAVPAVPTPLTLKRSIACIGASVLLWTTQGSA
jgi:hypothetical protein